MKVIFLDFDGVLNTLMDPDTSGLDLDDHPYGSVRWGAAQFSITRIGYLNRIIKETGSKVVLSTSWREVHPQRSLAEMLRLLAFDGFILGSTPTLHSGDLGFKVQRHHEIQAWVDAAAPDDYIIIDDIDMGPLNHRLVRCENGLEEHHIQEALTVFSRNSW